MVDAGETARSPDVEHWWWLESVLEKLGKDGMSSDDSSDEGIGESITHVCRPRVMKCPQNGASTRKAVAGLPQSFYDDKWFYKQTDHYKQRHLKASKEKFQWYTVVTTKKWTIDSFLYWSKDLGKMQTAGADGVEGKGWSDEGDNADGPNTESRAMKVTALMAPIVRESDEGDSGGDIPDVLVYCQIPNVLVYCQVWTLKLGSKGLMDVAGQGVGWSLKDMYTSKKSSQDTTLSPPVLGLDVLVGVLYRYQYHIALHLGNCLIRIHHSTIFMGKRSNETICTCAECLEQGGVDASGNRRGRMWDSLRYKLHISRINRPSPVTQALSDFTAQANEELSPEQEEDMRCEGARRLLALVLSDPQPNAEDQPPRHWTSLDNYQESRGVNNHLPNVSTNLPMDDIIVGVRRLFIQHDPQHPSSSPSDTEETNDPHRPTDPCVGVISSPDRSFHSFRADRNVTLQEPVRRVPPHRTDLPKADQNSWSIKALIILSNIEYHVALCSYKLATLPLEITLLEAQSEVATLHSALEQVDHRTTFILQCKQEIMEQLDKLEDHVEAEKPPPEPSNDPVYVDCAHHYDIPVNHMTDITQVSVFLGV
ncbi:hypothetical protein BU17DRAFT_60266 [Hysterangium stoloniferum]|nr:hypothetical protein BU17DRAFT_60266 [Hysterangium stoloniferum]